MSKRYIIIGAGLTGLTAAYNLLKKGNKVTLLEATERVGGQIRSYNQDGFIFESGPNTGVISNPEVAELFKELETNCTLQIAESSAKKRLILKNGKFKALPSGIVSAITTPLFTFKDKISILGEPFRKKGSNPDESVGELAQRRLGKSFLEYAVDPFISGIYAGDPMKLVTKYALPKLYNLEQEYGSFIKGSIAKAKTAKTERDKLATKEVFSAEGGLSGLVNALRKKIKDENIILSAKNCKIKPLEHGFSATYTINNETFTVESDKVVTTCGAYCLPELLPFITKEQLKPITDLEYAPVIQASVAIEDINSIIPSFGGLIPSKERQDILGVLFPSTCFTDRAPEGYKMLSFYLGGVKRRDIMEIADSKIEGIILKSLKELLEYPENIKPKFIHIFRHPNAIPQYNKTSKERIETIQNLESQYKGLILAGNIIGGIGMADRIKQASNLE